MPEPSARRTACGYYLCCPISFSHTVFDLPKVSSLLVHQVSSTDWSNRRLGSEVLGPLVQLLWAMQSSIPWGSLADWRQQCPGHPLGSSGATERDCFPLQLICSISEERRNQQTSIPSAQIEAPWLTKQIVPMGTSQDAATEEKLSQKKPFSRVYPPWHTRTYQASVDLSCDFLLGMVDWLVTLTLRSQGRRLRNWATGYSLSQNKRQQRWNFISACHRVEIFSLQWQWTEQPFFPAVSCHLATPNLVTECKHFASVKLIHGSEHHGDAQTKGPYSYLPVLVVLFSSPRRLFRPMF